MITITLGDPLSVNVRAICHILSEVSSKYPILLVGSRKVWKNQTENLLKIPIGEKTGSPPDIDSYVEEAGEIDFISLVQEKKTIFLNIDHSLGVNVEIGEAENLSPLQRGSVALESLLALKEITNICDEKNISLSVLTCPIDKAAASKAGFDFPGHTEYFEAIWGGRSVMVLSGPNITVGLVTNHLALSDVPKALSENLIVEKYKVFEKTLKYITRKEEVTIAVCGVNPHLSDNGMFGREELDVIKPACDKLKNLGHSLSLCPADTAFYFNRVGKFDGVLAMYHDQGLGPLKALDFDTAINLTGGLRHFRVSPDHGPVSDKLKSSDISIKSFLSSLKSCINYLEKNKR